MKRNVKIWAFVALHWLALAASPASAHPHVLVEMRTEMLFDAKGAISGIKHIWTFDEFYSAFASQGLDANKDGKLDTAELAPLAQTNVESLQEFNYFTTLKFDGQNLSVQSPKDYSVSMDNNRLTLTYTLPLSAPLASQTKPIQLEIYDPTFFVAFYWKDGETAQIFNAPHPKGACAINLIKPDLNQFTQTPLSQNTVAQSNSYENAGSRFANRALINCPQ